MSTSVIPLANLSPGSDLQSYINTVSAVPLLSQEEEQELAHRFYDDEDLDAARELIISHLRFVVHVARTYRGYGLPEGDLIQEGNVGLMKAVKRFDPNVGVRLMTFAVHWIRAEIHEFILRNWRIVKIATTKAQRKLFFKLRAAKKNIGWLTHHETEAIADELGVRPQDVSHMENRLSSSDVAFDASDDDDDDESPNLAPAYTLIDDSPTPETLLEDEDWSTRQHELLHDAINSLDDRSKVILMSRWMSEDKATLHDLASQFGVSAERIRQIENNAMGKIRDQLLAA